MEPWQGLSPHLLNAAYSCQLWVERFEKYPKKGMKESWICRNALQKKIFYEVVLYREMPNSKTQEIVNKQHLWTRYLQSVAKTISHTSISTDRENTNNDLVIMMWHPQVVWWFWGRDDGISQRNQLIYLLEKKKKLKQQSW